MTILAQTVQLAFRIAIVWTAGFLLAVAVNALLPDKVGITLYRQCDHIAGAVQSHWILDMSVGGGNGDRPGGAPCHACRHWLELI